MWGLHKLRATCYILLSLDWHLIWSLVFPNSDCVKVWPRCEWELESFIWQRAGGEFVTLFKYGSGPGPASSHNNQHTILRNFLVSMVDRDTFIHRCTAPERDNLQSPPTFSIIPTRRYSAAVKGSSADYLLRFWSICRLIKQWGGINCGKRNWLLGVFLYKN